MQVYTEKNLYECLRNNEDIELQEDIVYTKDRISSYNGVLDGNGYTIELNHQPNLIQVLEEEGCISNCWFDGEIGSDDTDCVAVVLTNYGRIEQCEISITVTADEQGSTISIENYGVITKCTSSGEINSYRLPGGLVVTNKNKISDCVFQGSVEGKLRPSGIAVHNDGMIIDTDCGATITGALHYGGGIVWENEGKILNCIFTGDIEESEPNIAHLNNGTIENSI